MRTLIVYNHPYDGSFCHAILETVKESVVKAGNEIDVIELDSENFNPVMTAEDLRGFLAHKIVDDKALEYANRLKDADHLVMIFPIWWELMPALTKGFVDKVIFPGAVYEYGENGISMNSTLIKLKSTTVITTMNTPGILYKVKFGNAIQKSLINGTFKKLGFKNIKWINFDMVKFSKPEKRKKWLADISKRFSK